jgi:hypothetical protein
MDISLPEDGVIFELESGELSATVILAGDMAMKHEAGPIIHPTFDEKRVIVAFNQRAYKWRIKKLIEHFEERRPWEDRDTIIKGCVDELNRKYIELATSALGEYFINKGLAGFAETEDNPDDEV